MEHFLKTATLKQPATAIFSVIILIGGAEAEECLLSRVPDNFFSFHHVPAKIHCVKDKKN